MSIKERVEARAKELFNIAREARGREDLSWNEMSATGQIAWETVAKHFEKAVLEARKDAFVNGVAVGNIRASISAAKYIKEIDSQLHDLERT